MMVREETRRERYDSKREQALVMPVSLVTVNFEFDDNLAFLIRTAACYGVSDVYVIGSIPPRKILHPKSGSLSDEYELRSFSRPGDFLRFAQRNDFQLISAELTNNSTSLHEYSFDFSRHTCIVLGNEMTGVPVEILYHSEVVHIPMPGVGFCLNTSQTGTAFVHECSRQFLRDRFDRGN